MTSIVTEPLCLQLTDPPIGLVVKLAAPVVMRMRELAQHQPHDPERGGVLVGRYYEAAILMPVPGKPGHAFHADTLVVDAITEPGPRCHLERHAFDLDVPHHLREAERLAARHEGGGTIVGGWHTHPQWCPVPSDYDLKVWRKNLLDEADSPIPTRIQVLVGTVHIRAWAGTVGVPVLRPMREFDPYAEEAKAS